MEKFATLSMDEHAYIIFPTIYDSLFHSFAAIRAILYILFTSDAIHI